MNNLSRGILRSPIVKTAVGEIKQLLAKVLNPNEAYNIY
jgi:hypothetical protein